MFGLRLVGGLPGHMADLVSIVASALPCALLGVGGGRPAGPPGGNEPTPVATMCASCGMLAEVNRSCAGDAEELEVIRVQHQDQEGGDKMVEQTLALVELAPATPVEQFGSHGSWMEEKGGMSVETSPPSWQSQQGLGRTTPLIHDVEELPRSTPVEQNGSHGTWMEEKGGIPP